MESTVKQRLMRFLSYKNIGQKKFAQSIDMSSGYVNAIRVSIQPDTLHKIAMQYPDLNTGWLMTGEGSMLKDEPSERAGKLIPFYDDVVTVGGNNEISANMQGVSSPAEYIDTGDWFKDATAALRHYGDSMTEYPPGCILALKEVEDLRLIVPGKDYVIETSEYRVTKRVQVNNDCIRAHSTNDETYPDGTLIHQPFNIPFELISKIFLVLGYVVKKNGGTMVFSSKK